jgi:hypothetical protein
MQINAIFIIDACEKGFVEMLRDFLEEYLFGYGVLPQNPLILGLVVVVIFAVPFWFQEVGCMRHLCVVQALFAVLKAFEFSFISFLATPQGDGGYILFGIMERIAGLVISSSFLVVLAKKILR